MTIKEVVPGARQEQEEDEEEEEDEDLEEDGKTTLNISYSSFWTDFAC